MSLPPRSDAPEASSPLERGKTTMRHKNSTRQPACYRVLYLLGTTDGAVLASWRRQRSTDAHIAAVSVDVQRMVVLAESYRTFGRDKINPYMRPEPRLAPRWFENCKYYYRRLVQLAVGPSSVRTNWVQYCTLPSCNSREVPSCKPTSLV